MKDNPKLKVVIADDHWLFRGGMRKMLAEFEDIKTILEVEDGKQLLELLKEEKPDVVLLDLEMPVMNGTKVMPILNKDYPDVGVIIISMHKEPEFIAKLIKDGAHGYLLKDTKIEEVIKAIRTVATGKEYRSDLVSNALIYQVRERRNSSIFLELGVELSSQEEKLLRHLAKQLKNDEIANKMSLSMRTVEYYRARLMQKLGVKNSAGLVAYAIKHLLPE